MFLKRLVIVGIIALLACFATGSYFDARYRTYWSTLFFNSTDTLLNKDRQYDIVLLGNSRIHFGLNPFYIDSATGMSSFNFGIGGADAAILQLNTELYLQNHPAPKYAVIGTDVSMVVAPEAIYTQYHLLYYLHNDIVYRQLKKYHPAVGIARYIPFTRYSFFNEYNRSSLFKTAVEYERFDHNIYKGFINPHRGDAARSKIIFGADTLHKPVSSASIAMLRDVVARFKNAGTQLLLVSPPLKNNISIGKQALFSAADSVFYEIAKEYGLMYLQAGKDTYYDDKYFVDDLHLNEPGTRIFSRQIGDYIKQHSIKK